MADDDITPYERDPDVLTTAEVAARLGLSAQTVRRMANAGQLPALKTGKDFRYSWTAVRALLTQTHAANDAPSPAQAGDVARHGAGYRARRRAVAGTALPDSTDETKEEPTD